MRTAAGEFTLTGHSVMCALWSMVPPKRGRLCFARRGRAILLPADHSKCHALPGRKADASTPLLKSGSARTSIGTLRKRLRHESK